MPKAELRFSYASLPDHPASEIVDTIVLADELGFHGAYMADETYHKDGWLIAAVAATRTRRIRLSPCVTHVILKEPTILAHTIATLDELSGGAPSASSRSATSRCSSSTTSTGGRGARSAGSARLIT